MLRPVTGRLATEPTLPLLLALHTSWNNANRSVDHFRLAGFLALGCQLSKIYLAHRLSLFSSVCYAVATAANTLTSRHKLKTHTHTHTHCWSGLAGKTPGVLMKNHYRCRGVSSPATSFPQPFRERLADKKADISILARRWPDTNHRCHHDRTSPILPYTKSVDSPLTSTLELDDPI